MFFVTYLQRELLRRTRQAVFVALGLALGIGLVVTVSAASTGVKRAETQVLGALDGIGTDVTVTGVTTVTGKSPATGSLPVGTPTGLAEGADGPEECFVGESCQSLNGKTISLVGSPYSAISTSQLTEVAGLHDVKGAVGGLTLLDQTGTFPKVPTHILALLNNVYLDGVDTTHISVGPLSTAKVVAGHELTAADRDSAVAVVDSSFAASNNLKVGSSLTVGTGTYTVIGIITQPGVSNPIDIYIPLAHAQALATQTGQNLRGEVNTIYVTAASAADIATVHAEITRLLPDSQIATQSSLASEVTGSITSAEKLATDLGKWLSILVLIAAFAVAGLLTMAAVGRRATEFGTLKAIGWRSRRIIGQALGETVSMGVVGAAAGVGLGYAGASILGAVAPKLSADVPGNFNPNSYKPNPAKGGTGISVSADFTTSAGGNTPTPTHLHGNTGEPSLGHTVAVTLHPAITFDVIGVAVGLALLGGLLAGALASWRIARLRPADALGRVA